MGYRLPQDQYLATWLLSEEQVILQNEYYYNLNLPDSEIILGWVVQYIHADLDQAYFNRSDALARQTAFYNPNGDGKFNQDDWDFLMSGLEPIAKRQLNRHWNDNYSTFMRKKLDWWDPNKESWAAGIKPDKSMYGDLKKEKVIQNYAIVNR